MFVDDQVIGLRLELVNDILIPCVAEENPTFLAVRGVSALPDQPWVFQVVRRIDFGHSKGYHSNRKNPDFGSPRGHQDCLSQVAFRADLSDCRRALSRS
jgi:hypothetical protein